MSDLGGDVRKKQSGVMLLEALIAILIFSLGILGVVGMQASAIAANRDAKYRTDAGLLANELIGEMMSGDRSGAFLKSNFQGDDDDALGTSLITDGTRFLAWRRRVRDTFGVAVARDPRVTVVPGNAGPPQTSSNVSIEVFWMLPNETVSHRYVVVVQII
jgi:type IV pilus assembly protein PilV